MSDGGGDKSSTDKAEHSTTARRINRWIVSREEGEIFWQLKKKDSGKRPTKETWRGC